VYHVASRLYKSESLKLPEDKLMFKDFSFDFIHCPCQASTQTRPAFNVVERPENCTIDLFINFTQVHKKLLEYTPYIPQSGQTSLSTIS
jgi:hypothetical protein